MGLDLRTFGGSPARTEDNAGLEIEGGGKNGWGKLWGLRREMRVEEPLVHSGVEDLAVDRAMLWVSCAHDEGQARLWNVRA